MVIATTLAGCQSDASSVRESEIGRTALERAFAESSIISSRRYFCIVYVQVNPEFRPMEYRSDPLANWAATPQESWIEFGKHSQIDKTCAPYSAVISAVPRDVRQCELCECLWMRGFSGR
ncbi:MAG: hypothetical protein AAF829_06680 [Pseudomonadota bacterium]